MLRGFTLPPPNTQSLYWEDIPTKRGRLWLYRELEGLIRFSFQNQAVFTDILLQIAGGLSPVAVSTTKIFKPLISVMILPLLRQKCLNNASLGFSRFISNHRGRITSGLAVLLVLCCYTYGLICGPYIIVNIPVRS